MRLGVICQMEPRQKSDTAELREVEKLTSAALGSFAHVSLTQGQVGSLAGKSCRT